MDDLISRRMAIDAIIDHIREKFAQRDTPLNYINGLYKAEDIIEILPSAERKKGKWIEKHHVYSEEENSIEEWQSCRCSECGRYDTRPYLYFFDEPRFCSWCGAEMRGEEDEAN